MRFDRVRLEGAKELDQMLASLGTEVATKIGVAAARASAREARDALIRAAPYDPSYRLKYYRSKKTGVVRKSYYGHLRDNIRSRRVKARTKGYVGYDVTTGRAFWGYFLEVGTAKMRARPWARPAIARIVGRLMDVQVDVLTRGISKAAKRARRMLPNGRSA